MSSSACEAACEATQPVSWSDLPPDLLAVLGSALHSPQDLKTTSLVCKAWQSMIPSGVEELEVDMNSQQDAWTAKVQQLGQLVPSLRRCKAYVSSAVPQLEVVGNIKRLARQLRHIQHLDLELSEGYELCLSSGDELSGLAALRSLTLSGGRFSAAAAERLISAVALACPQLEQLRVLPEPTCGLGDDQVPLLCRMRALQLLEFRAHRLTAAGLTRLTAGLPQLASLSCHGLDTSLDAATASCFAACPSLRELHLGSDYQLPDAAVQQLRDVLGDVSIKFRWTDRLTGLLRTARLHLQARLVRLDLGCVKILHDPGSSLLEPLAALTALSDLRMRLYSNTTDATLTLHLSQISALSNLQVLHLTKQHAYFPEQRKMRESSISVPLSAASAASLAAGCKRLRSLQLCLGSSDISAEGLANLRQFSSLKSLCVNAEPFGCPVQPVALDLLDLPHGLTNLELRNIDIITPPAALAAAAARCPPAAQQIAAPAGCVLSQLACLKLESCRLRTPQLQALSLSMPSLQQLRLVAVAGLTDAGVTSLSSLTSLLELAVLGPLNSSLTQNSLQALATLRGLRKLSWQSDDLTALGPCVAAYSHFTTLRLLSLSCTPATLDHACGAAGGRSLFQRLIPYCNLDLIC